MTNQRWHEIQMGFHRIHYATGTVPHRSMPVLSCVAAQVDHTVHDPIVDQLWWPVVEPVARRIEGVVFRFTLQV